MWETRVPSSCISEWAVFTGSDPLEEGLLIKHYTFWKFDITLKNGELAQNVDLKPYSNSIELLCDLALLKWSAISSLILIATISSVLDEPIFYINPWTTCEVKLNVVLIHRQGNRLMLCDLPRVVQPVCKRVGFRRACLAPNASFLHHPVS